MPQVKMCSTHIQSNMSPCSASTHQTLKADLRVIKLVLQVSNTAPLGPGCPGQEKDAGALTETL